MRANGDRHNIAVVAESVLQLSQQRRVFLFVFGSLLVDRSLRQTNGVLETRPQRSQPRLDLNRTIGGELPGQIQSIEIVRLDQSVRTVDELHAGSAALEQFQVLGAGVLVGMIRSAADGQDHLESGKLALQFGDLPEMALFLVEVQLGVQRLQFIVDETGRAVDQVGAECQGWLQIGESKLA